MNRILDLIPAILFFISYKLTNDMIIATIVILASVVCTSIITYIINKTFSKIQLFTLFAVLIFGIPTILFKDPLFIKLKPSFVGFSFALLIFIFQFVLKKNPFHFLLGKEIPMKKEAYASLGALLFIYFIFSAILNIIIAFYLPNMFDITQEESENLWVWYKTFGNPIIMIVYMICSFFILMKKYPDLLESLNSIKNNKNNK